MDTEVKRKEKVKSIWGYTCPYQTAKRIGCQDFLLSDINLNKGVFIQITVEDRDEQKRDLKGTRK